MTTDLDDRLAALRPTPHWTQHERAAVLDRVLADDRGLRRADLRVVAGRSRRRTVMALAALGAAAAVVVPTVLPSGSPGGPEAAAAAELRRLAAITAPSPSDRVGPGEFLHSVGEFTQQASHGTPAGRTRSETWTSGADGKQWTRIRSTFVGSRPRVETYVLGSASTNHDYPSKQYLASLPTDPDALEAYLRRTTNGEPTMDEAIFSAVPDLLDSGIAPRSLRTAAIDMLAGLGHITIGSVTRDAAGNPVREFVFRNEDNRPGQAQSIMFDTRTAQLTEQRQYVDGKVVDQGWTVRTDVADRVPADVVADAVPVE